LEKTSKIIKSNHHPNTTMPTKPYPEVPHVYVFWTPPGQWLYHCPGQPLPTSGYSLSKEIFPNIQSKPPLMQLEAISSYPIASYLGEETNTHLTTASFQVVVESNTVSPQPPLLQTKQPQFPQPLLIGLVL